MAGFKNQFINVFSKAASFISSDVLLCITRQRVLLPFYHIVSDENPPHIRHLYQVKGVKAFRKDLEFLLSLYEPVDYFQFKTIVEQKKRPSKPVFLLTFDDGLREFHDVVAPILQEKGIPAICFLNSGFIDNQGLFFRYKVSLLIAHIGNNPVLLVDKAVRQFIGDYKINGDDFSFFLRAVTYQSRAVLDILASLVNYDFQEYLSVQRPYLSTEQISSLLHQGFHFGAHSIDHPEYRFLRHEEQIRQTKESMESICTRFRLDYKVFSFPFTDYGVQKSFFERVCQKNIADVTFGCAGQKRENLPSHYQRLSFETEGLSAKEIYNSELIYFALKAFLGKNTIQRE